MSKLQQLKERAFQNPEVRHEYDALAEEFEFIDTLLKMPPSSVMKHHNKRKVKAVERDETKGRMVSPVGLEPTTKGL